MNAVMRIQVRVINGATPEIKQIQAALNSLAKSTAAAQAMMAKNAKSSAAAMGALTAKTAGAAAAQRSFAKHLSIANLEKYGKNLQWTGRQIEFNFTLPLLLAGGAAFKWAMANERAFVQVKKVYGDTAAAQDFWRKKGMSAFQAQTKQAQVFNDELSALEKNFKALSSAYGVNLAEVNQIAGEWAAAGASGAALAQSVKLTMEAMILGDMDAAKASESLIAIQAQYGASTKQLMDILGSLNAVENQTGATMGGLIDAFSRAAGSARTAGVDYRHLAAMIAALTPATGSAANAGNALKTVLSRILAPTKDAADLMDKMGLNTKSAAWASKNGTQRLTDMAKAFEGLTQQQKASVSAYVASRYQVNRFDVLMRELNSTTGYYAKALEATSSPSKIAAQYQRELSTVLQSNPKRWDILTNSIKNSMADAIIPFIPAILGVMSVISKLAKGFANLDPGMQKLIVGGLLGVAVFGTFTRVLGASILLFTRVTAAVLFVGRALKGLILFRWVGALVSDFGKIAEKVFGKAGGTKLVSGFKGAVAKMAAGAGGALRGLGAAMTSAFVNLGKAFIWLTRTMPLAVAFLRTMPATIGVVFSTVVPIVTSAMAGAGVAVATAFTTAMPLIIATVRTIPATIGVILSTTGTVVMGALSAVGAAASAAFSTIVPAIIPALSRAVLATQFFFLYQIPGAIGRGAAAVATASLKFATMIQLALGRGFAFILKDVSFFFFSTLPAVVGRGLVVVQGVAMRAMIGMQAAWRLAVAALATAWTLFPTIVGGAMSAAVRLARAGMIAMRATMAGGALLKAWGALWTGLVWITANGVKGIIKMVARIIPAIFGIWGVVAAVVGLIAYTFRDKIMDGIHAVIRGFQNMPAGIAGAFRGIINVIAKAITIVRDLLSYLNPFQRHSPSLVDNVKAGVAVIAAEYGKLRNIGSVFSGATKALANFGAATARAQAAMDAADMAENRKNVVAAAGPAGGAAFDAVAASMKQVKAAMAAVTVEYQKQAAVVAGWQTKLDAANATLAKEEAALKSLQSTADAYQASLQAAQDRLASYVNAPLVGEKAMNQAILDNTIAQKRLQLQMMNIEDATGPIDDVVNRLALMQGAIETLRGTQADLRAAGAGGDILGVYDDQIKAIQDQQSAVSDQVKQYDDLKKQIDDLQRSAERLDLEKYLNYDSVHEQIQLTIDSTKELTKGEVLAGIAKEGAEVARLTPLYAAAAAAVDKQTAAVAAAQAKVDSIQAAYDKEKATLDQLGDAYDALSSKYDEMSQALSSFAQAAESAMSKAKAAKDAAAAGSTPALDAFNAGGKGNFKDAGLGSGLPARTDWTSQVPDIDKLTQDIMKDAQKSFAGLDPFDGIKKWWNKTWDWVKTNIGPKATDIWNNVKTAFTSQGGGIFDRFKQTWDDASSAFGKGVSKVKGWWNEFWKLIGPSMRTIGAAFSDFGKRIKDEIIPAIRPFLESMRGALVPVLKVLWWVLKQVGAFLGGALLATISMVAHLLAGVLSPVLNMVVDVFKGMMKAATGLLSFFDDLFHGRWGQLWDDVVMMLSGLWDTVFGIFNGAAQTVWGIIKGFVQGIWDWFHWLWDELVGHSIIPDMVRDIIAWIGSLPGKAVTALKDFVSKIVGVAKGVWKGFKDTSVTAWTNISTWIKAIPQSAYDAIIAIKTKLGDAATTAWSWMKSKASSGWETMKTWIKALPQSAYDNIIGMKTKLGDAAKNAFQALIDKAKAMVDGKGGFIGWVKEIPGKIATAMAGVGSAVTGAVKSSWNASADWLNKNGLANINKVTEKFGLHINSLPHFAGGGVIPGSPSKHDNTIIAARTGEGVIVPELVRLMGGARGLQTANNAARRGNLKTLQAMGLPGYRDGGVIGQVAGGIGDLLKNGAGNALSSLIGAAQTGVRAAIPGRPFFEDYMAGGVLQQWKNKAKSWGDKQESTGNGALPGIGWQYQVAALKKQFPGIIITSTNRPGAITASGNTSYHSMGRAVDMAPDMKYFDWISKTYGKNTKELIYSPAGARQLKNGKPFTYTGAVKDMHYNHVHWAYDRGGFLNPGLTMAMNKTGKQEMVLTAEDYASLTSLLAMLDKQTAATPGAGIARSNGALMGSLEGRLRRQDALAYSDTGGRTININGDLVLPNIKSGEDAEAFIKHLETLAG